MVTTQHRRDPEMKLTRGVQVMRGFDYLTLDPSPMLRKMRGELQKATKEPTQVIREAWLSVGAAIREALELTRGKTSSRQ